MLTDPTSRRAFVAASGAVLGALWLSADPKDLQASFASADAARRAADNGGPLPDFEVFTPEQAADFEAIAAQIVPTDDLPGAREARVVYMVDHSLATWNSQQKGPTIFVLGAVNNVVTGRYPGVTHFAALENDQQIEIMRTISTAPYFGLVRFLTLMGLFGSPSYGGNKDKIGWQILGFEDRFVWEPPFGWYDAKANGGPN